MSLQIAIAHTGQRFDADLVGFSSVDALKSWIAGVTQIPPESQILLTPRGKHVKLQALLTEKEIYVFNRSFSTGASASALAPLPLPEPFVPEKFPNELSSHTDLRAWRILFQARRDWAFDILEKAQAMSRIAAQHFAEQATIDRGTQIAIGNHDSHIRSLGEKYGAAKEWWDGVAKETGENLRRLDADYAQLGQIPARPEFIQFLAKSVRSTQVAQANRRNSRAQSITLQDYVDADALKKAAGVGRRITESFGKRVSDMGVELERASSDYNSLLNAVGQGQSRSIADDTEEPKKLYEEIQAVAKKIQSDLEHVMGLPATRESVAQVSKMALLHTRNFLPAIKEYSVEMSELVRRSVDQKNLARRNALESMRTIASIESAISTLGSDLDSIDLPQEGVAAFELVSLINRLPYIYGTLLVEAVRRREWVEKMKKDTSSLAEEMAVYQEEEERRRKRWLKPIADVINTEAVQGNMLGFEMNVQPDKSNWPAISREDLQDYLTQLQRLEGQEADIEALNQAIKDLDRPTKQQVKRAKNFKNGSVHEAAFGRGSQLLLRGDDDMRVLKEANMKLEEELKTSKSRVRRLEDLVHRQSVGRHSMGSGLPSFGPQSPMDPSTPTLEGTSPRAQGDLSRRSSISSRRFSTTAAPEDKRRILKLEKELAAEKEARAALEKEAQARPDADADLKRQVEEALSTKTQLMENMKAQQKEFSDERRSLEEEIRSYKAKIEEAEDELDRVLGSRDNERAGVDAKIQELTAELNKVRAEAAEQAKRADTQIQKLQKELGARKEADAQKKETLTTAFNHLSSDAEAAPEDLTELIAQLEDLAIRSANHQTELQRAVAMVKSENETARHEAQEQITDLKTKLNQGEAEVASLREQLDIEKAKSDTITNELEEERGHLRVLRDKFAKGETGSEALRKRVAEEEAKVEKLQLELAESISHANSLDVALMHAQKTLKKYEDLDSSQSHQRARRATEISQRLYAQHERLLRLMDTLGFIVTYEDGNMAIQRPQKINGSVRADHNGLSRSGTTPSPTPLKGQLEDGPDLSFLQWSEASKPSEEDHRFTALVSTLDRFNVETFSEAVSKRMRDMEHTVRKWQKEARAYRDKSHRFQAEAHEKIAYRSFKEGDVALFLPTRNQATRPWAAFNVGAPHYFLREQDSHKLHGRDYLVARISKIEERVVDLSKRIEGANGGGGARASVDGRSIASSSAISFEDDNPFELSDGLRWFLVDAVEEKPGAPGTPGLGKTTVASARVLGQGQIEAGKKKGANDPAKSLGKSLDSRRSSGTSRKGVPVLGGRPSAEGLEHAVAGSASPDAGSASAGVGVGVPGSNVATRGASPAGVGSGTGTATVTSPAGASPSTGSAAGERHGKEGVGLLERLILGRDARGSVDLGDEMVRRSSAASATTFPRPPFPTPSTMSTSTQPPRPRALHRSLTAPAPSPSLNPTPTPTPTQSPSKTRAGSTSAAAGSASSPAASASASPGKSQRQAQTPRSRATTAGTSWANAGSSGRGSGSAGGRGLWDSLFQLDIQYQGPGSGRRKRGWDGNGV